MLNRLNCDNLDDGKCLKYLLSDPVPENVSRVGGLHPLHALLIKALTAELLQKFLMIAGQKRGQSFRLSNCSQAPVGVSAKLVLILHQVLDGDLGEVSESLREVGSSGEKNAKEGVYELSVFIGGIFIEREAQFLEEKFRISSFVSGRIARQDLFEL